MRSMIVSLLLAGAALSIGAATAQAAPAHKRHHHVAPRYVERYPNEIPLTVNRRSWLDPGPAVPVGHDNAYVIDNTVNAKTPDQVYDTARFGNSTLRGQPYAPGRSEPVAEFSTGPNFGDGYIDPLIGPRY